MNFCGMCHPLLSKFESGDCGVIVTSLLSQIAGVAVRGAGEGEAMLILLSQALARACIDTNKTFAVGGVVAGIIVNNLSVLVDRPLCTAPMVLLQ